MRKKLTALQTAIIQHLKTGSKTKVELNTIITTHHLGHIVQSVESLRKYNLIIFDPRLVNTGQVKWLLTDAGKRQASRL